jgi:hypothetical protein
MDLFTRLEPSGDKAPFHLALISTAEARAPSKLIVAGATPAG